MEEKPMGVPTEKPEESNISKAISIP